MRALVLSGGGAKGAYEIGVWKALRKLKIKYDIVTGTSVGALNGTMVVQNDFCKALKVWQNIDYTKIIEDINIVKKNKVFVCTHNFISDGGTNIKPLENLVENAVNPKKFFKSKINFGLITYNFSKLKPAILTKKDLTRENLKPYVIASATCFPFFKKKEIDSDKYIDGGYYDNLPINLALSLGADEVIAVDLKAVGLKRKVKNKDVKITYISPQNDIGDILKFEKNSSRQNIRFGYNDTMKLYKKLDGNKFTFKKNHLVKNYQKYGKKINNYIKTSEELNDILEKLGLLFNLDESKIYSIKKYNKLLKKKVKNIKVENFNVFKLLSKEQRIVYLMNNHLTKFPKLKIFNEEVKMAVYLKMIDKRAII